MSTASLNKKRIGLVKVAALGDVAQASRALNQFSHSVGEPLEVHWVIDAALKDLACALADLKQSDSIVFHTISAFGLFQGSVFQKTLQSLKMLFKLSFRRLDAILLLHRDTRYQTLFSVFPWIRSKVSSIRRSVEPEFSVYTAAFSELKKNLKLHESSSQKKTFTNSPTGRIGVLVGGAQNAKLSFNEKRWPYLKTFVQKLSHSEKKVVLFGGKEDLQLATEIQELLPLAEVENLVGKTTLKELPLLLKNLDVFVSIDSGLAHIAAAVMTAPHQKVLTLFGPTDPSIWAPVAAGQATVQTFYKKPECSPCYKNDGIFLPCKFSDDQFQKCMKSISAEEVLQATL